MIHFFIEIIRSIFYREFSATKNQIGKKLTEVVTFMVVSSICLANSILFLFFLSLTFFYYLKEWHGDIGIALIGAATLNIITLLLVLLFREQCIKRPLSKIISKFMHNK